MRCCSFAAMLSLAAACSLAGCGGVYNEGDDEDGGTYEEPSTAACCTAWWPSLVKRSCKKYSNPITWCDPANGHADCPGGKCDRGCTDAGHPGKGCCVPNPPAGIGSIACRYSTKTCIQPRMPNGQFGNCTCDPAIPDPGISVGYWAYFGRCNYPSVPAMFQGNCLCWNERVPRCNCGNKFCVYELKMPISQCCDPTDLTCAAAAGDRPGTYANSECGGRSCREQPIVLCKGSGTLRKVADCVDVGDPAPACLAPGP